ncbi:DUF4168 domain-containing protein [Salinarimonas chemoclinalis]|uniref:DUF4168 domain-containing protein n=1 Tax=Salinarimonas chemoclinalis TaxID=3241599 RepID=UPI003555FE1F
MKTRMQQLLPILAAAFLLAIPGVSIQAAAAQETGAEAPVEITEEKVEAFAVATLALAEINRVYEEQAARIDTEEERERLMAATNLAMMDAVERVDGISIDEYNAIATAAREDGALADTINEALVQQMR